MLMMKPDFRLRAIIEHGDQRYGEHPYAYHLAYVENFLVKYGFNSDVWRAAAWLHDSYEDCGFERVECTKLYGEEVDALVWACTGIGENRKTRNASIHEKLLAFPTAAPLKAADRIANITHARRNNSTKHIQMYTKEYPVFRTLMVGNIPDEMLERLDILL